MACLICKSPNLTTELDLGAHAISSFFQTSPVEALPLYPMALGQCPDCGTIQLMQPVPHAALLPPYLFLAREPEEHLDDTVARIVAMDRVSSDMTVGALTFKDDTTVDRFKAKGFETTWRIDPNADLSLTEPNLAVETIQKFTTEERMGPIAERLGPADILIVRHIFEHAEDVEAFAKGISALVKPGGLAMIEVPDCTASLKLHDYTMVWEEHSLYLTPNTFRQALSLAGFETVWSEVYPLPFENSLVQVVRKRTDGAGFVPLPEAKAEIGLLADYAADFGPRTEALRRRLSEERKGGKVALFGAGHLACHFVNFHGLGDLVDLVLDDTPEKQGKFLPGAGTPIVPAATLDEGGIGTVLFAVSIQNEDRILAKNRPLADFAARGGKISSIFVASPRSIHNDLEVAANA